MKYYHKIETAFNRSTTGNKTLIENSFRSYTLEMLANCPIWDFYEKLDGSNHAIEWDGHNLTLHGRTDKSNFPKHIIDYYNDKFNNNETEELFEQIFSDNTVVLYFEAIGPKIQTFGSKYCDDVKFVLLDAYFESSNCFANYEHLCDLAKALNVDVKLCVGSGTLFDAINYVKSIPMSKYSKYELPMEGVICLPKVELKDKTGNRIVVKIKGCDHAPEFNNIIKRYK